MRLNHHPETPPGEDQDEWQGRTFHDKAYVRVERQLSVGFPKINAAMFLVRPYFYDCAEIKEDPLLRGALISAIESMSPASLAYKGIDGYKDEFLKWLTNRSQL